ncbi:MAG TPA: VOC family protein [Candidatus Cloacimonadota bacterium]|nr:VOC family protein [Candidatus Cloacimonadota bacterium]HOH79602.1 VOC family protein [Candidatus Cloacimonadota bacterium]
MQENTSITGSLHHVEIYVRDLKISREFWNWLLAKLGYTVFQEWDAGVSFIKGDCYLVFVQTEERWLEPRYHRCRTGLNHLAFHGGTREFIDSITRDLETRGVSILYRDRHPFSNGPDCYAVFFEDPDRIKVEITL